MKNYEKDKASGVLVTSLIGMLMLCVCVGFAVDLTRAAYIKSTLTSQTQEAVNQGVRSMDSNGGLSLTAANKAYSYYLNTPDETRNYTTKQTSPMGMPKCHRQIINGVERKLPYVIIRLDTKRSDVNSSESLEFSGEFAQGLKLSGGSANPAEKYTVISMEIYEASNNFMFGILGKDCQVYRTFASAVTFGNNKDL